MIRAAALSILLTTYCATPTLVDLSPTPTPGTPEFDAAVTKAAQSGEPTRERPLWGCIAQTLRERAAGLPVVHVRVYGRYEPNPDEWITTLPGEPFKKWKPRAGVVFAGCGTP